MNLVATMKKVTNAVAVISAGIAVMQATEIAKPDRKKVLMDALNALEGEFKIDLPDNIVSVVIEVLLAVGKLTGAFGSEKP